MTAYWVTAAAAAVGAVSWFATVKMYAAKPARQARAAWALTA